MIDLNEIGRRGRKKREGRREKKSIEFSTASIVL